MEVERDQGNSIYTTVYKK